MSTSAPIFLGVLFQIRNFWDSCLENRGKYFFQWKMWFFLWFSPKKTWRAGQIMLKLSKKRNLVFLKKKFLIFNFLKSLTYSAMRRYKLASKVIPQHIKRPGWCPTYSEPKSPSHTRRAQESHRRSKIQPVPNNFGWTSFFNLKISYSI